MIGRRSPVRGKKRTGYSPIPIARRPDSPLSTPAIRAARANVLWRVSDDAAPLIRT
jgi:hypothetical protein